MSSLERILTQRLHALENKHCRRQPVISEVDDSGMVLRQGKKLHSFGSNDYLGLSHHPAVKAAAKFAVDQWGVGAGASQLLSGYSPLMQELESTIAGYYQVESACVLGSGYLANIGAITALVGSGDLIVADKLVHACMIDGSQLSGAAFKRFRHNDIAHLESILSEHRASYAQCLILCERVYSMDGDTAPLEDMLAMANRYDAWLLVDDAHGMGVLAPHLGDYIHMGTFSKALGSYGGYIAGAANLIAYLKTTARSLMFSTALPPASISASLAALQIINEDKALIHQPLLLARQFTQILNLPEAQSAIVPFVVGDEAKALNMSKQLEVMGYYVPAIRPPTVPPGTARLRFAFSALHTSAQIEQLANAVKTLS